MTLLYHQPLQIENQPQLQSNPHQQPSTFSTPPKPSSKEKLMSFGAKNRQGNGSACWFLITNSIKSQFAFSTFLFVKKLIFSKFLQWSINVRSPICPLRRPRRKWISSSEVQKPNGISASWSINRPLRMLMQMEEEEQQHQLLLAKDQQMWSNGTQRVSEPYRRPVKESTPGPVRQEPFIILESIWRTTKSKCFVYKQTKNCVIGDGWRKDLNRKWK